MPTMRRRERDKSANSLAGSSSDAAASVATFEFEMDMVRDSSTSRRRRGHKRNRPFSSGHEESCGSNDGAGVTDIDEEAGLLLGEDSQNNLSDDIDRSSRSSSPSSSSSYASSTFSNLLPNRSIAFSILIGVVGLVGSTCFLGFGIENAVEEQERLFQIRSSEVTRELAKIVDEYIIAAQWVHQACAFHSINRQSFRGVYEYLDSYLEVKAVEFLPRVLDSERADLEKESAEYWANFTEGDLEINYQGIIGLEQVDPDDPESPFEIAYRSQQDIYYPIHYIEPVDEFNIPIIEFDLKSSEPNDAVLTQALETWEPTVTRAYARPTLDGGVSEDQVIQFIHPGMKLSFLPDLQPKDVSSIVVAIKTILEKATKDVPNDLSVYLYDATESPEEPEFLIAAEIYVDGEETTGEHVVYLEEMSLAELVEDTVFFLEAQDIQVASRTWRVVVVALEDTFLPNIDYIITAGKFILVASLCIALWIFTSYRRTKTVLQLKRKADLEKTAVILRSARDNAKAEQELNDYIAHEIRNPLSAAMTACTFVKSTVNDNASVHTKEGIEAMREDIDIIDSSLTFTHDLLRSMLDMHRAANRELIIQEAPLDIQRDVLDPVIAMLYKRQVPFEILSACPSNLVVQSDRLRLKQILLNLCRNATRFVSKGYVKVGAIVNEGNVQLFVEDSGYGISEARKKNLFSKFQESLEVMDQGSGVGLCLCKSMANMLDADIWLDEKFDSGVKGFPGSRFVLDLKRAPMEEGAVLKSIDNHDDTSTSTTHDDTNRISDSFRMEAPQEQNSQRVKRRASVEFNLKTKEKDHFPKPNLPLSFDSGPLEGHKEEEEEKEVQTQKLPENLSVLFVDDDMILRKLFMRSVRKVVDTWDVNEASSGEAALKLVDEKDFDIIFMDQYMSSVEKQLLGTETTKALRSKGVTSRIYGLSANDVEEGFWTAGADGFMFKPFPCKKDQLETELLRILSLPRNPSVRTEPVLVKSLEDNSDKTRSTSGDED